MAKPRCIADYPQQATQLGGESDYALFCGSNGKGIEGGTQA